MKDYPVYRDKIYLLRDPVFRGILRRIREYERAKEMAKKCCVCGTKMGFFAEGSCLGENTELNVCETCFNYMNRMHVKIDQEDLTDLKISRDYFGKCIQDKTVLPEALDELRRLFENAAIEEKNNIDYHQRKAIFKTTTGYNFEGYVITDYKNVVNGEVVLGTGFLSELSGQVNDFFGSSSGTFEGKISKAKNMALDNVIAKALMLGANALIGIDFDIMTLSNNMIAVSTNGTAVVIEKI